ncbi:LCP family protein [Massilioclostridium coli]|uniref:LCP family glycopolymer transferase n=1 Tax=Massilioclostridium coli TaxID=1870991 RepID=UPI0022E3DA1D|nr:LCP family protein [Massilioclostridium coli]
MKQSVRLFLKSFLLSFIIIGGVAAVILIVMIQSQTKEESPTTQYVYQASKDEDLTTLLIFTPSRGGEAERFLLLHISAMQNRISIAELPITMKTTVNGKTDTISGMYDYGGAFYAVRGVSEKLEITIHRYMRIDYNGLIQIVDYLGGMAYTPSEMVETIWEDGSMTVIQPVEQMIDGRRFLALAKQGDIAQLLSILCQQQINKEFEEKLDDFYSTLMNETDSNCSSLDYELRKFGWKQMLRQETAEFTIIPIESDESAWIEEIKNHF